MSDLRAGLGRQGARRDRPFAGQPPPAVGAAVAFAALLAGAAQVVVQRAAAALVGPDVAVDGFVTDREQVEAAQPPVTCSGLQSSRSSSWTCIQSAGENRWLRRERDRRPPAYQSASSGR